MIRTTTSLDPGIWTLAPGDARNKGRVGGRGNGVGVCVWVGLVVAAGVGRVGAGVGIGVVPGLRFECKKFRLGAMYEGRFP